MDSAFERHCSELVARERSGHTAVVEDNLLYVWGGYMVSHTDITETSCLQPAEGQFMLHIDDNIREISTFTQAVYWL